MKKLLMKSRNMAVLKNEALRHTSHSNNNIETIIKKSFSTNLSYENFNDHHINMNKNNNYQQIENHYNNNSNNNHNNKLKNFQAISLGGGGFVAGPFNLGAINALMDYGLYHNNLGRGQNIQLAGASAGALIAAAIGANYHPQYVLNKLKCFSNNLSSEESRSAYHFLNKDQKATTTTATTTMTMTTAQKKKKRVFGYVKEPLTELIESFLYDDICKNVNNKVLISVTKVKPNFQNSKNKLCMHGYCIPMPTLGKLEIIDHFESKEDLKQALLTSCYIPIYMDQNSLYKSFRNGMYIDGGYYQLVPELEDYYSENNTIKICAFTKQMIGKQNVDILPSNNILPWSELWQHTFVPGSASTLDYIYEEGYLATENWIFEQERKENLKYNNPDTTNNVNNTVNRTSLAKSNFGRSNSYNELATLM